MSKYVDIIRMVDSYKPNAYDDALKVWWLVNLDGQIAVDIMQMEITQVQAMTDCSPQECLLHEPLVGPPFEELYTHYLEAKISYADHQFDAYQNAMEQFNTLYRRFAVWFLNNYDPAQGYPEEEESDA